MSLSLLWGEAAIRTLGGVLSEKYYANGSEPMMVEVSATMARRPRVEYLCAFNRRLEWTSED